MKGRGRGRSRMFNKSSKPQNRIDSLIGATTRIEGNVIFSGGLRVDGMVRGNVGALPDQPSTLVISSANRVVKSAWAARRLAGSAMFKHTARRSVLCRSAGPSALSATG